MKIGVGLCKDELMPCFLITVKLFKSLKYSGCLCISEVNLHNTDEYRSRVMQIIKNLKCGIV